DSVRVLDVSYRGRWGFLRDAGEPFAHMAMRDRFDALLLEQARTAGAEFRPGTTVRGLEQGPLNRIRSDDGAFEAEAEFVVCADGAHSPVGRMAGLGGDIAECAAWEVEVRAPVAALRQYRSRAMIDLGYHPWGYAWVFPKAEVLSIGIVLPPEQAGAMKARVRAYTRRLGLEGSEVEVARGHKVRFRRGDEPIAAGTVLLAGDAAGLADEFTEEGIFYAVQSGRIAARTVLAAMSGDGQLAGYEAAIDREVMPELRAARLMAFMFYGMLRRTARQWMWASAHTGYLWNAFFAVQRGESTYAREVARVPLLPALAARMLRD
ncbi:MAG: NAD(P)/FAD-dependent oxidoreductase, partial [Dehalococcoidia bacterium]